MLSKFSVKKPYTVVVGILLALALGIISFVSMSTDLLPSMNMPYVVVYTTYIGATPERVESEVTRPMEAAFSTLSDIKSINSTSSDNVSVITMEFSGGANMDGALIEISSKIDLLRGTWNDSVDSPVVMKLNPDMLPISVASVSMEDSDLHQLSDFVNDTLVPRLEGIDGVASVNVSGAVEESVRITIDEDRIDIVNSLILKDVDAELAKVEQELKDAQQQLSDGKRTLASKRRSTLKQIDDMLKQMNEDTLTGAVNELVAQRDQLQQQLNQVEAGLDALDSLASLTPEQQAQLEALHTQLAQLQQQKAALEAQRDALDAAQFDPDAQAALEDARTRRAALVEQRDGYAAYIDEQQMRDPAALNQRIQALSAVITAQEQQLGQVNGQIANKNQALAQLNQDIAELEQQIAELEATPSPDPTPGSSQDPGTGSTPDPSQEPGTDTTPDPSQEPGAGSSPDPSQDPGADATPDPSQDPGTGTTPDPSQPPQGNSTLSPSQDPGADATPDPSQEPGTDTAPSPSQTPEGNDALNASQEPGADTTPDPSQEPQGDITPDPSQEPGADATPDPSQEPEADATPDPSQAPDAGTTPDPSQAPDAGTTPDPSQAPETGATPGPSQAPEADPTARPSSAPEQAPAAHHTTFPLFEQAAMAASPTIESLRLELENLISQRTALQQELDNLNAHKGDLESSLEQNRATLASYQATLDQLIASGSGEDTSLRVQESQRQIDRLNGEIAQVDQEIASLEAGLLTDAERDAQKAQIQQQIDQVDAAISAITSSEAYQMLALAADEDAYNRQYAELTQARAQLSQGIAQMDVLIDKLQSGIIPAGFVEGVDEDTPMAEAEEKLRAGRSAALAAFADAAAKLQEAEEELAKGRSEFYEKRDEALEDAGIDGIITMEMVAGLVAAQNFSMPAGYVGQGDEEYMVRVGEEFASLDELRRMRLFSLDLDSIDIVSLSDVAQVDILDNADEVFTKVNGADGLMLSFQRQSIHSTADVAERITDTFRQLETEFPGLDFVELMNQGDYIDMMVESVMSNMIYGAVLAVLVLFVFLLDIRPTLIVALSIPISVLMTFVCMYFTGITLNVLSLAGLALGIGMLVDNSIVAIENIYRLRNEEHMPVLQACVEGVRQISGALFSSTLTTICVFLPVIFVEGMTRDLFGDIGLTIAYSLLSSLLVAMTVVPTMAAGVLRKSKPSKERFANALRRGYTVLLRGALKARWLVLLLAVALLGYSVHEVLQMSMSFLPDVSSPQMTAILTFEEDSPESAKKKQAMDLMDAMLQVPSVDSIGMTTGAMIGVSASESSLGDTLNYYIVVDKDAERSNVEIGRDLLQCGKDAGLDLDVQTNNMDITMLSGSGIAIDITGSDLNTLRSIALEIAELASTVEGAGKISDGLEKTVPEMSVVVDKDAANAEKLTVAQVFQFLAAKLADPQEITDITITGKEYPVRVVEGKNLTLTQADLEHLEIEVESEDSAKMVRVGDIADVNESLSMASISRRAQQRSVTVTVFAAEGYALSKVSDALSEKLEGYTPPEGYTVSLSGENEMTLDIIGDLMKVVLVALLFIFLIMVAQFQSFKSPFIVMFTIPLAFTGGLLSLLAGGMDLSVVAIVGFLLLFGVVVNNGIVFVETVNQLRIGGMEKREAILETGRIRLRPILMTALTTILGMALTALGRGMGAELMQPMAVVSAGGLIYATFMTLFIVPILYDIIMGKKLKAREIEMIRESAGLRSDEEVLAAPDKFVA